MSNSDYSKCGFSRLHFTREAVGGGGGRVAELGRPEFLEVTAVQFGTK